MSAETRYAKSGDVHIAYQVVGDGSRDVLFVPGWISHLELGWRFPPWAHLLNRLASFSRLVVIDKRGTGLSDPVTSPPTLEERVRDLCAVMDAVGSERVVLFGDCEAAPLSVVFAAAHPERTEALVLYGAMPCVGAKSEGPRWIDPISRTLEDVIANRGQGKSVELFAPSVVGSERARRALGEFERASASPGMVLALLASLRDIDVGSAARSVHVPTLMLHRRGDFVPIESARRLAELIPGARFVELEGQDHVLFIGDSEQVAGGIEGFVTGTRHRPAASRALLTVLFTDIVGSTRLAAELGDASWARAARRAQPDRPKPAQRPPWARGEERRRRLPRQLRRPRARDLVRTGDRRRGANPTSSCAPGSTPARSSCSATTSAAWPSTSAPASLRSPDQASCS